MSWYFNDNGYFYADFGAAIGTGTGITIGYWQKMSTMTTYKYAIQMGIGGSLPTSWNGGVSLAWGANDGDYKSFNINGVGGNSNAVYNNGTTYGDGVWVPVVGTFYKTSTYTDIYVNTYAQKATGTGSDYYTDPRWIIIGQAFGSPPANGIVTCDLAEIAVWDTILTQQQITDFMDNHMAASGIANASLKGYWPLSADGTQSDQSGNAGPTLTKSGSIAFQSASPLSHPTITGWTTKYLKMLVHSSAAGASSVSGVVFSAPTGGNITGTTRYGEFTGASFTDGGGSPQTDPGYAVLKVAVSEFGGSALTTSDTPVALARTASNTTGIVPCTVIEE